MKKLIVLSTLLFNVAFSFSQVKDLDGNEYSTTIIDKKEWTTENLKTKRFANGEFITQVFTEKEWKKAVKKKSPAWCYYKYDSKMGEIYGILYNWYAVNDPRGLAPQGWHVPTKDDWDRCIKSLGGSDVAGSKMKIPETWNEGGNNTNESNFGAKAGGAMLEIDKFEHLGLYGYFWSSSEATMTNAYSYVLHYLEDKIDKKVNYKYAALSVRCVRD